MPSGGDFRRGSGPGTPIGWSRLGAGTQRFRASKGCQVSRPWGKEIRESKQERVGQTFGRRRPNQNIPQVVTTIFALLVEVLEGLRLLWNHQGNVTADQVMRGKGGFQQ